MRPSLPQPVVARLLALLLPVVACAALAGCEDLPSDPTPSQRIFGRWASVDTSQIALYFRGKGARQMQMEFESDGNYTVRFSGTPFLNGTYLTRPSVSDDRQRAIEMRVPEGTGGNYFGAYRIVGDTMLIEVVPTSESPSVTTPDEDRPLPNAQRNGQITTEFISRLVREP